MKAKIPQHIIESLKLILTERQLKIVKTALEETYYFAYGDALKRAYDIYHEEDNEFKEAWSEYEIDKNSKI